jgi:hypothetical protein
MNLRLLIAFLLILNIPNGLRAQNIKTTTIESKRYIGCLDQREQRFYVLKSNHDTVLNLSQADYFDFQFKDFNKDGYKDVYLDWGGNTPDRYTLYLFIPSTAKFKELRNFSDFPSANSVSGTSYYYSYYPSGCADDAWGSHLFYIKDYSAIKIGKIKGDGCGIDDHIDIFKVVNNKESLIKRLPLNTVEKYKDKKWGFIKEYWNKNYKSFL